MPASDSTQAVKWPNVPACYDWLSLNRRGCWLLKGQPITHDRLIGFINNHYGPDRSGNWVFQNGPQTVYVTLNYTPYVFRLDVDGRLTAHTGVAAGDVAAVFMDEEGNALMHTKLGIGLLDDRDLSMLLDDCVTTSKKPAPEEALLAAMIGCSGVLWNGLPLQSIFRKDVPVFFRFQPSPVA